MFATTHTHTGFQISVTSGSSEPPHFDFRPSPVVACPTLIMHQIMWFGSSDKCPASIVAMPNVSFQHLLAPIILAECLHARVQDSIYLLTSILEDTPTEHQPVRLAIIESIRFLEDAAHQLRFTRLVLMLVMQQRLQQYLQRHQSLPALEDVDDSSDSQP